MASARLSAEQDPTLLSLDQLAEHWRCEVAVAVADAQRLGIAIMVCAEGWLIEWGAWVAHGANVPSFDKANVVPTGDPVAADDPSYDAGATVERGGVGWLHHLGPRRVTGLVGLTASDVHRLAKAGGSELLIREVDGRPHGVMACGRLQTPGKVVVDVGLLRVATAEVWAADDIGGEGQAGAAAARRSRELLDLIWDADRPGHASELALAVDAWRAVVLEKQLDMAAYATPRQCFLAWLSANRRGHQDAALERIATLLNPNPRGGRPPNR